MGDFLFSFLATYVLIGVIKVFLVLPNLPSVAVVYHRYYPQDRSTFAWFFTLLPVTALTTMATWPRLAASEGLGFLVLYPKWRVMREVLCSIRRNMQPGGA